MKRITLFVIGIVFCSLSSGLMALPEGAIARLGKGSVKAVAFSPDGRFLAVASSIGVWLYDAKTFDEVRLLESDRWLTSLAFSPDGSMLASGSYDDTIKLWDTRSYKEIATLKGHTDSVRSVSFSPDGSLLASGSDDGTVILWDISKYTTERIVSITSGSAQPGASVTVHLSINNAVGIAGGDFLIKYDANVLTVVEVKSTSFTSGLNVIANTDVPGEIRIGIAGTQGLLSGRGVLVEIGLKIGAKVQPGIQTILTLSEGKVYNESGRTIPVKLENGVVKIIESAGIKGDVNNDGKIASNDAILAMRIAIGLVIPTDYQKWAADMNGDGKIGSDDAILILRKAAGLSAPYKDIIASDTKHITISLSEAHGVSGETIEIPVKVDNYNTLAGGDIVITYDPEVLCADGISFSKDLLLVSDTNDLGKIRIAFANVNSLDNGIIATLRFKILSDAVSSLRFQMVKLYRPDALPLKVRSLEGKFISWAIPPEHSALLQNFPNPFNPETWIPYQLKEGSEVKIRIYTASGELVRELSLGYKPAGVYISRDRSAYWDGRNESGELVASGIYFYTIKAGDFIATKKMVIAR